MSYADDIASGGWKQEWLDMPEFVQEDRSPYRTLYIHFRCEEDVQKFAELIGQTIYPARKFYWYPERPYNVYYNKRYVDEEDMEDNEWENE